MQIVVAGSGPSALLLAAGFSSALADGGRLTLFEPDSRQAAVLARNGCRLRTGDTTDSFFPAATADPAVIRGCDLLILFPDRQPAAACLQPVKAFLTPDTTVVCIQRGVEHVENPPCPGAIACVSDTDVFQDTDGTITCNGPGVFLLGATGQAAAGRVPAALPDCFARAGLRAKQTGDIRSRAWERLCIDAAVNPLAAIYGRPNGQLLTSCSVRGNLKKCLREIAAVARALGVNQEGDPVKQAFHFLRTEKNGIAPMLRDVREKRPTEIGLLNGYISRRGRELGIATPVNDDFTGRIRQLEAGYR